MVAGLKARPRLRGLVATRRRLGVSAALILQGRTAARADGAASRTQASVTRHTIPIKDSLSFS
jgi:hypothetical protein